MLLLPYREVIIMKHEITKLDTQANLKQSNNLIEAKYRLTTYEQRMVIAICSQLTNETEFPKIRVDVNSLADFCKFPSSKKLNYVRATARRLRSRTLEYQKPNGGWYITGWINSADLLDDGTIEFTIDPKLTPQLLQLKSAYLSTPAAPLMEFKCDYTARFYFLLKKMLKIKEFEYTIDFFKERFQLSKSYALFANMKNKVIEPAILEINEKSDIQVKHEYIKEGRSYKKIHFTVTLKKEKSEEEKMENEIGQLRLNKSFYESDEGVTDRLIKRGVTPQKAKNLAKKYSEKQINENINYALKNKNNINNLAGFIIDCVENNVVENNRKAKEEIDKKEKERLADDRQAKEFFNGKSEEIKGDYEKPVIVKNGKVVSM